MTQQLEGQQQTLSTIQNQHKVLLLQIERPEEVDLEQVRAFLNTLAQAGTIINVSKDRALLLELIRYWSNFISDKTGGFPVIRLQPLDLPVRESGLNGKSYLRELIENPLFRSIDNDKRIKNLAQGYWVYEELLNGLARNGWVRFAPGYKGAVYGKKGSKWCIKVLGMGVGEDPLYFCEKGFYLEHEREMLETFKNKGFNFQPDVKSQKETIEFLISEECGISPQQAELRVRNNDVLVTQYIAGIPFATQTGVYINYFLNISIMDEGVLGEMHTALTVLKEQLCRANSQGLLHNDVVPPNIIFTLDEDKIIAKLVDFETAQDMSAPSPDFVTNTVHELYRERQVPVDIHGVPTKTLDQHLIDENLVLLDKLIQTISERAHLKEQLPDASLTIPSSSSDKGVIFIRLGQTDSDDV